LQLEQAGFTNVNPIQEPSDSVNAGEVIRTDPAAGTPTPLDTKINLFVSTGAQNVSVPGEVGKTFADAKADLENRGFTVTTLKQVDDANVGIVLDQNPGQGQQVAPKSTVTLTVGIRSSSSSSTTSTTLPETSTT
jgi:eukaryotic-like serine/threonine-protein kinase